MSFFAYNYLMHHGIKGMKWGVRRYQNKDGTWTAEGQRRRMQRNRMIRATNTKQDVEDIVETMHDDEKKRLGLEEGEKEYLSVDLGYMVAKRVVKKSNNVPVAFFDLFEDGTNMNLNASIGTRSGEQYRGHGYATKAAKEGLKWYDSNKERLGLQSVTWGVRVDNKASRKIAKKLGFQLDKNSYSKDKKWVNYVRR